MRQPTVPLLVLCGFSLGLVQAQGVPEPSGALTLTRLATYHTGAFDESAAEIVAHDPETQRLFIVNARSATLDVLDIRDPSAPVALAPIHVSPYGAVANSVDVHAGVAAVAVETLRRPSPVRWSS